jgi:hypothetical protein
MPIEAIGAAAASAGIEAAKKAAVEAARAVAEKAFSGALENANPAQMASRNETASQIQQMENFRVGETGSDEAADKYVRKQREIEAAEELRGKVEGDEARTEAEDETGTPEKLDNTNVSEQNKENTFDGQEAFSRGEILEEQKSEIARAKEMGVENLTTQQKGNFGEMATDVIKNNEGFTRISNDYVTSLDDVGHKGLDGVYEHTNSDSRTTYTITETKFGSSELATRQDGKQGSFTYNDNRLDAAVGPDKADEIRFARALEPDSVKSELARVDANGDIRFFPLDNDGNIIKETKQGEQNA